MFSRKARKVRREFSILQFSIKCKCQISNEKTLRNIADTYCLLCV